MAPKVLFPCLLALAAPALSGCIARTAVDVVTAPVKVVGGAVDMATTSQSEADRKRGRKMRQREERLGQLGRIYRKELERCREGDAEACRRADAAQAEAQALQGY